MGPQKGELASLLSRRLVGSCGVGSSSSSSGLVPPALSGPGICDQLREVRPQADQQGSVSWNADRHRPGEGLPGGLLDYQIVGSCGQVPSSPVSIRKDVTVALATHGISGVICALGLHSDASSSVAAEVLLVFFG